MFKTNDKKDRVDYSNVLIPPDGYTLNFAVGSTYSLDLEFPYIHLRSVDSLQIR